MARARSSTRAANQEASSPASSPASSNGADSPAPSASGRRAAEEAEELRKENARLQESLTRALSNPQLDECVDNALQFKWRPTQVPHDPDNPRPRHHTVAQVVGHYSLRQSDPESAELLAMARREGKPGRAEEVLVLTHLASYLHDSVAFVATPVGEAATVEELKEDMVAIHDHLLAVLEMVHLRLEEVEVQIRTPNDAVLLNAYAQRYKQERRSKMSAKGRAIHDFVAARRRTADITAMARASAGSSSSSSQLDF